MLSDAYVAPECLVAPPGAGTDSGATRWAGSMPVSLPVICSLATEATPTSAQMVVTLIVARKCAWAGSGPQTAAAAVSPTASLRIARPGLSGKGRRVQSSKVPGPSERLAP